MSGINSIVKHLNDKWKGNALSDSRFPGVKTHGVAIQIPVNSDSGLTYDICELQQDGTVEASGLSYETIDGSVMTYHRILSTYRKQESGRDTDSFGDETQPLSHFFNMSMLVFMNRKQTKLTTDQMDLLLMASMENEVAQEDLPDGYLNISFTHTGSEYNSQYLYEREFNLKNYSSEPDIVLFEFKYTIECSYSQNCGKVLCCPT